MNAHDMSFRDFAPADAGMDMHTTKDADVDSAASVEAEQALLGAILVNNDVLDGISYLEPEDFGEEIHGRIFAAIRGVVARGKRVDPVLLAMEMKGLMVGDLSGAVYLARLAAEATTIVNAPSYALAIREAAATRLALAQCRENWKAFAERPYDMPVSAVIASVEDGVAELRAKAPTSLAESSIGDAVERLLQNMSSQPSAQQQAVPFPLPEIGTVLQEPGFQVGNLYGLLGASGEGKTSLVLQIVRTALDAGHPVLLMSYDQTDEQVIRQMISQATGISVSQMIQRRINHNELSMVEQEGRRIERLAPFKVKSLSDHKIGAIVSIAKLWAKRVRKMRQPDGQPWRAPLIVLDHNRKVRADDPRADAGSKAAVVNGAGKALARELEAVVLFLNQRNGKGMDRYVPRPIAEDLFGGEQAKEDYDSILYIYRPERWRDEQISVARDAAEAGKISNRFMLRKSWNDEPRSPEGMAEIGAIKTRYGAGGVKEFVKFEGRYTRYVSDRPTTPELF